MTQEHADTLSTKKPTSTPEAIAKFLSALVPFLWFVLAVVAFYKFFPIAKEAIQNGTLNKLKVGVVEVELTHVVATNNAIEVAKEGILISPEKRKQLTDRFANLAEKTKGAAILWVDDNHPFQNVAERRVFIAAGITVDTARTTSEAVEWLARANYDVLISDQDRRSLNDPPASCFANGTEPSNAGCALLKKVGGCFEEINHDRDCNLLRFRPNAKAPVMILYTSSYRPDAGMPAFASGITTKADDLIDLVLDALDKRQLPPKS